MILSSRRVVLPVFGALFLAACQSAPKVTPADERIRQLEAQIAADRTVIARLQSEIDSLQTVTAVPVMVDIVDTSGTPDMVLRYGRYNEGLSDAERDKLNAWVKSFPTGTRFAVMGTAGGDTDSLRELATTRAVEVSAMINVAGGAAEIAPYNPDEAGMRALVWVH